MNFLELTLVDGNVLDIPPHSVAMFEQMTKDTNPNFPNARCFLRYHVGGDMQQAVLTDSVNDMLFKLGINVTPMGWLKLTRQQDGMRVVVQGHQIVARRGTSDGCEIVLNLGTQPLVLQVTESRDEVKKQMEGEVQCPESSSSPSPAPPSRRAATASKSSRRPARKS